MRAYGQSKLANLMFTYELQRRLSGPGTTIAVAAHPGFAATELMRNSPAAAAVTPLFSQNAAMGALPVLRAPRPTRACSAASTTGRAGSWGSGATLADRLHPAIPRRGRPAPPVGGLGRADRGHVPGLTGCLGRSCRRILQCAHLTYRCRQASAGRALPTGSGRKPLAKGHDCVDRVEQGDCRPVVHRVLGQGLQPGGDRLLTSTGKTMRFTGTTVLKVENGLITEEIGLDDGVSALRQLGLIRQA